MLWIPSPYILTLSEAGWAWDAGKQNAFYDRYACPSYILHALLALFSKTILIKFKAHLNGFIKGNHVVIFLNTSQPITIMVKARKIVFPIALTMSIGITGAVGFSGYRSIKADRARETSIQRLVDRFRSCPDTYRATGECHSPQEIVDMLADARANEGQNRYRQAGLIYARLGRANKAREMSELCEQNGDLEGSKAIDKEMALREEAAARMR
jgi:hypothetical protein